MYQRNEFKDMQMISAKKIAEILNVSKQVIFKLTAEGSFPRAYKLGDGRNSPVRWKVSEIQAWIEEQKKWKNQQKKCRKTEELKNVSGEE